MAKFLLDLWLDGYNSEEEMKEACEVFIDEQLNMTTSSVKLIQVTDEQYVKIQEILKGEIK